MSELLTIGEVAAQAGLRTSALRYYEQTGLLRPATRVSGQRRYDAAALDRLAVIQFCRRLGFSLSEIRVLLTEPRGSRQQVESLCIRPFVKELKIRVEHLPHGLRGGVRRQVNLNAREK